MKKIEEYKWAIFSRRVSGLIKWGTLSLCEEYMKTIPMHEKDNYEIVRLTQIYNVRGEYD